MLARMWRKGNPLTLLVGMHTGAGTAENSTEIFQKLKLELPCDPATPLLDIYPKKNGNTNSKRYMHLNVHSSIAYNCQDRKQLKCPPTDE